jgi:hypothetical protein
MKKYITSALTVLFATISVSLAAPDKDALIAKEKSVWQSFKDKKADDFKKLVADDVVAIYADGIKNMKDEMEAMSKTTMKSFSLSDFNVVMPDADTAIISYKAKVETSANGKDESGNYNCGSVWNMKNGEWKAVFHADNESRETGQAGR